jgi:hypothetical protein
VIPGKNNKGINNMELLALIFLAPILWFLGSFILECVLGVIGVAIGLLFGFSDD